MTSIVAPTALGLVVSFDVSVPDYNRSVLGTLTHTIERLPTESVGTFTLTLTNIVIGSVVRIEIASTGVEVETRTADTTTEVFSVPAYSAGSVSNDLRIKVRKGTAAPKYLPFSTLATASVGAGSVYVAQVADTIA